MSIPRLSISRPVAVSMFFVAISFLGFLSLTRLPVDLLPDVAYPKLIVYTSYPEVGPAEVERFITERIEAELAQVPGRIRTESVTREGTSLITLWFAWGTDMDFAVLNTREKLDGLRGSLPEEAERPVVLRTDPRSEPIMAISVAGDESLWSLKELSENVFRRRLEQIDGVAQAAVAGGLEREIHVDVNLARLESYGLTIDDLAQALDAANAASVSGRILRGRYQYSLRTLGELQDVNEIGSIVVSQPATATDSTATGRILVRDVATVTDGFEDRESIARYNGKEAIGLLVFKESGANTVGVARDVGGVLDQLREEYPAITLEVATSQAGFVSGAIANLIQEMILGGVLAFLVLILFLRDPRYPVAIALAIPISVVSTFAMLHAAGVSLNIMSLGGLALGIGMLVDNSIVVIENIFRHTEKGIRGAAAAAIGSEEVQRAITASTLTTIAVFGPIIYVEGVAGELFKALSFAVAFSLLASLVVAVSLLPMMAARWDTKGGRRSLSEIVLGAPMRWAAPALDAFDRGWNRLAAYYEATLEKALHHRARVVILSAIMLVATIPFAFALDRSVLPDVDQGEFRAILELPRGTPLEATAETAGRLEALFLADPAVEDVFSRIGKQLAVGGIDEESTGLHTAVLEVKLKDGELTSHALDRLRPQLGGFPLGSVSIETGHATALGKLLGGGESDLAVRVRGDDIDEALVYAEELEQRLAGSDALANVRVGTELGQPEYLVQIDRDRAAAYGFDANRVANVIENHMRGAEATQFVAFDRKIPIIVRLPEAQRRDLSTLQSLRIDGVPVSQMTTIRESVGPVEIQRLDQSRFVPVYADVRGASVDDAVAAVRTVVAEIPPPGDLRVDVGGENEEMRKSFRDLGLAFALAILLVYMILAAEFESFIHPFTVLLSVPLGLIGAILALWLTGAGLNSISLIGIVILVGIVDNDAVVKIDFINQMRREGMNTRDAIRAAGHARLRPIVMNTITTMLAITPMMLGIGAGSGLQAPLAIAVFGGLFTSTILTLIVIPIVYELVDDLRVWLAERSGRSATIPGTGVLDEAAEPAAGD